MKKPMQFCVIIEHKKTTCYIWHRRQDFSSVGRALGHSNCGYVVRIPSVEVDLAVTFGADVGTGCVLNIRIQL